MGFLWKWLTCTWLKFVGCGYQYTHMNWGSLWYKYKLHFYWGLCIYVPICVIDTYTSMISHMSLDWDAMSPKRVGQQTAVSPWETKGLMVWDQMWKSLRTLQLRPSPPLSQPDSEQAIVLSAQLRSRFRLSWPLPHCKLFKYLIIPFASPEKRAQRSLHSHGYRRWAEGLWLAQGRLTVIPLQEYP